ncbi:MAG: SoxR reducing system RseC family protein [Fusobacteriaceae bacterium]
MISTGIIKKIEKNEVTIHFFKDSACAHCSACSADRKLGALIKISSDLASNYSVGDQISIELDDTILLKLSFITYIFPAIFMILGYFILNLFNLGEGVSIFGSFLFLVISFGILYFYDKKRVKNLGEDITIVNTPPDSKSCSGH